MGSTSYLTESLFGLCKKALDVSHVNYAGAHKQKIIAMAMSQPGSDFPGILENLASKQVLKGYDEQVEPYTSLARIGSIPDFKIANRSGLSAAPSLQLNQELQEVETIELSDRKQSIQLATYAGRAGMSRHAIINDDLGEFGRMLVKLGQGAKRTVGDQFANVFTQNVDGQSIDEGSARIFDSGRNNTGTGGIPSTATFTELRTLMAKQTDVSGNAVNLNIQPRFIYCPIAQDGPCRVVNTSQDEVTSAKTARTSNIENGRWEILSDARLDGSGLSGAATRYYALGDPDRYDTIEVAFLDGNDQPMITRVESYDVLGVSWVVSIDCVAQALDFRAMAVNDGS